MSSDLRTGVSFRLNGLTVTDEVKTRQHLADYLREEHGLTGTHLGCEHGVCGACSVMVDGLVVRGCLSLTARMNGRDVDTIEGLAEAGLLKDLQAAFERHNAAQCGFCTSGMLMTAYELCRRHPDADRTEIREYLSGNFCRCTGYQAIVDAVEDVLSRKVAV